MKHNEGYETRVAEGNARNEAWRKLSPAEQAKDLDARLGVGLGATRQRQKLCDHKFVDSKICLKCGWNPKK